LHQLAKAAGQGLVILAGGRVVEAKRAAVALSRAYLGAANRPAAGGLGGEALLATLARRVQRWNHRGNGSAGQWSMLHPFKGSTLTARLHELPPEHGVPRGAEGAVLMVLTEHLPACPVMDPEADLRIGASELRRRLAGAGARERQVAQLLLGTDLSAKQIGDRLGIAKATVEWHTVNSYRRVGVFARRALPRCFL